MPERPFLSVITPCLNRAEMIGAAVESVLSQGYSDFEHIIIDGGSTDGTLEVLARYPHLKVISEADRGVYDAFNKGVHLAQGEVVAFLNSDDRWLEGGLAAVLAAFQADETLDGVVGDAVLAADAGQASQLEIRRVPALQPEMYLSSLGRRPLAVNAWFFKNHVFDRIGYFDLRYTISADIDFCLRVVTARLKLLPVHADVYRYLRHAGSITFSDNPRAKATARAENLAICEQISASVNLSKAEANGLRYWRQRLWKNEIKYGLKNAQFGRALRALSHYIFEQVFRRK